MADKKKPEPLATPLQKRLKKIGDRWFNDPEYQKKLKEWEQSQEDIKERNRDSISRKGTDEAKELIIKSPPPPHEQMTFSFMPTKLTRTSPFFPMSRKDMKDRPYQEIEWETSWGKIKIEGKKLSIHDESVLLSLLVLVKKHKAKGFETTQNELCKIANTHTGRHTYNAIWASIKRLAKTSVDLEITEGKGRAKKTIKEMTGPILIFGERNPKSGKLKVEFNAYFLEMYAASFITILDLEFRAALKGDIAKALYRFYISQRDKKYNCHVLTLAKAVNLNPNLPLRKIKDRIRNGNRELKKKGFLTKHLINKQDIVIIWKSSTQLIKKYGL
jgi:hypothetical protein